MAFPVSPVNNQLYNDGTYTYKYNSILRSWTKVAQTLSNVGNVVTTTGNVTSGNSSLTSNTVTVGNTVINPANVVVGNVTVSSSNIVLGNTTVGTSNIVVGNTTLSTSNITLGNTTITNSNVTVGNTTLSTNSISAPSFTGNVTSGNTSIVPVANGNVAISVAGVSNVVVVTNQGVNFTGNTSTTGTLSVTGNANVANLGTTQVLASANVTAPQIISNVTTGTPPLVVTSTTQVANLNAESAGQSNTVTDSAQPNITSVGTLTTLAVTGTTSAGNLTTGGTTSTTSLTVTTGNANLNSSSTLNVKGNANFSTSPNVYLGSNANIHITGGLNGYVLSTDGTGNLSWIESGGGGGGVPGGSNTQVQYNSTGAFAGSAFFTFNDSTKVVTVSGNLIANQFTMGAGSFKFSYSNVYFATTNSDSPNQEIISIPVANLAGADFTIISTDTVGNIRNITKMSAVILGTAVNYVEYSTLPVNGYIGDFTIGYFAGNIIADPGLVLYLSPQSANNMTHKMQITTFLV